MNEAGILETLEGLLGVSLPVEVEKLPSDTWILIDDAQLAFKAADFWKVVMKDLEVSRSKRIHVVIAATYDLASQGTTPYMFSEYPHLFDLRLTSEESEALYDGYMNTLFFVNGWMGFKDTLLKLAGGHVGVLSGGISMLHRTYRCTLYFAHDFGTIECQMRERPLVTIALTDERQYIIPVILYISPPNQRVLMVEHVRQN